MPKIPKLLTLVQRLRILCITKAAEKIEALRSSVGNAMFDEPQVEDEVEDEVETETETENELETETPEDQE